MLDTMYREIYNPLAAIPNSELLAEPHLKELYELGRKNYHQGISFQRCVQVIGSKEELAWKRGWDSVHIGDVRSLAGFDGTPLKAKQDD